jgi:hypothetical protein
MRPRRSLRFWWIIWGSAAGTTTKPLSWQRTCCLASLGIRRCPADSPLSRFTRQPARFTPGGFFIPWHVHAAFVHEGVTWVASGCGERRKRHLAVPSRVDDVECVDLKFPVANGIRAKSIPDFHWASVSRNLRTTARVAWQAERPMETEIDLHPDCRGHVACGSAGLMSAPSDRLREARRVRQGHERRIFPCNWLILLHQPEDTCG